MEENNKKDKLTVKQQKFAHEHFNGKSGTQAVIAAGYNVSSENSAGVIANQLLKTPKVRSYLQTLLFTKYPEASEEGIGRMLSIIRTGKDNDAINAFKLLVTVAGLMPEKEPSKNVNVNLKANDFKLPTDES